MTYKIKLTDYQRHAIEQRLKATYDQIEDAILDKYKAYAIEDINALDFDDVIEDIQEWHCEIQSKYEK